jgi:hypothetical protein
MNKIEYKNKVYFSPAGPEEMELGMYEEIFSLMKNKKTSGYTYHDIIDIAVVMTGISKELILESPPIFFDQIYKITKWVYDVKIENFQPKDFINIEEEKYILNPETNKEELQNVLTKYFFSYKDDENEQPLLEYINCDVIVKDFPDNDKFSSLLAVKVRPLNKKHDTEDIPVLKQKFKQAKLSEVLGFVNFFLSREEGFKMSGKIFLQSLALARIQQQVLEDWSKPSDGNTYYLNCLKKSFQKKIKSLSIRLARYSDY